jgi:hypothetical protein
MFRFFHTEAGRLGRNKNFASLAAQSGCYLQDKVEELREEPVGEESSHRSRRFDKIVSWKRE